MEQIKLDWDSARRIFTVTELTAQIRGLLGNSFNNIWVAGEISGSKLPASGHAYFTLKDTEAQIRCVVYRNSLRLIRFKPADGIAVIARGRIDVYEPRGEYQFIVETLEPQGFGQLQLAFEQLKARLTAEGLFSPERKKPLPAYPQRIGIVTSSTGAVIRDILQVIERRHPGLHIRIYPATVQGAGSVEAVVEGIEYFSTSGWADVLIIGRGGGSLEDLWTFNEEAVARAIAGCPVPTISAVGHETDFTIADFAADLRAPTPSAAAELAVRPKSDLLDQIDSAAARQERALRLCLARASTRLEQQGVERATSILSRRLGRAGQRVDELESAARELVRARLLDQTKAWRALDTRLRERDLRTRVEVAHRRLAGFQSLLEQSVRSALSPAMRRLDALSASLTQLSPLRILERGYSIVQDGSGHIVTEAAAVPTGSELNIRLWKGRLKTQVTASST